jgi:exopolysaccharide biosynthesis polyprenyl glycosylphosphotransferase
MIPENPPPSGGMGTVLPFPSAKRDARPGARILRCRLASLFGIAERLADLLGVFCALLLSWNAYRWFRPLQEPGLSNAAVLRSIALFSLLFVVLLEKHGEYRPYLSLLAVRETERLLRVLVESFAIGIAAACFLAPELSWTLLLISFVTTPAVLSLEKGALRLGISRLRKLGYVGQRAVILGAGPLAKNVYSVLIRSPKIGLNPVAIVDEDAALRGLQIHANEYRCRHSASVLPGPLSAKLFRNLGASVLIIADPDLDPAEMVEVMARAASAGVSPYVVSRDYLESGHWMEYSEVDGLMLARLASDNPRKIYELAKRSLDIVAAALGLLLLSPMLAVLAALVKLTSPGPAFFQQQRVGRNGRTFLMYKFRSMYEDTPAYTYSPTAGDDGRITPIGRFLRRTCMDELPQLWNVLCGEMSWVGPRPEMPFIAERYNVFQRQRLAVKPGLTGLWQLSGDRNYLIHENIEYDLYYLQNNPAFVWNLALQITGAREFRLNDERARA